MKNPLVIALVILGVLGGAVWYTNQNPPSADEDDGGVALIDVKDDQVAEVAVRKRGAEAIIVTRPAGESQWSFGGDVGFQADNEAIGLMVTNLANLSADRVVSEETTDWGPYDLDGDGEVSVDVKFRGLDGDAAPEPKKVIFGRQSPTGSGVYARLEGDPRLFTVFNYVKATFDKEVFDWRDKKLLRVEDDKVQKVALEFSGRRLAFGKSGEAKWSIVEPQPLRADNFTVGDLTRSLRNVTMTSVVDEGEGSEKGFTFDRPLARAEITDEGGIRELRLIRDGERYLARSSELNGVYEVPATFVESLDKTLEDFREKKLFDFGFAPVAKLTVRDGESTATLEKKDDKWLLASDGGREVESEKAQTLIDALRNLSATAFPSDDASTWGRYGLNTPEIEAEALSADGGAKPETVVISRLDGERVHAGRTGEPTVYLVEKGSAVAIRGALEALLAVPEPAEDQTPPKEE